MKSMKASICVAVAVLVLGLSVSTPSRAGQDQATALDQKVTALYNAGKYAAALPLARQSLAIREKTLAPDDEKVGLSLNNLAALEFNLGHYAETEPLYKRSLAISEKLLGPVTRKWQDC
jgi:tetratricopeptide (TPR) repeat protein